MAHRKWSSWPKLIGTELNGVSGVTGIGGTLVGATSLAIFTGTLIAPVMAVVGGLVTLGAVGFAMWKAIPPVIREPGEVVGCSLTLQDLESVSPRLMKLAVVGPSRAGKTTLKNRLSFTPGLDERTQVVTAHIVAIPPTPQIYIAVLDGGGEKFAQQFRISEPSDYLCIVLDHNSVECDAQISPERLDEHRDFLEQIRGYLSEVNAPKKIVVGILINKQDLWIKAPQEQIDQLLGFVEQERQSWLNSNLAEYVTVDSHSNSSGNDIAHFIKRVKNSLQP